LEPDLLLHCRNKNKELQAEIMKPRLLSLWFLIMPHFGWFYFTFVNSMSIDSVCYFVRYNLNISECWPVTTSDLRIIFHT
jgi:hypothetical protein